MKTGQSNRVIWITWQAQAIHLDNVCFNAPEIKLSTELPGRQHLWHRAPWVATMKKDVGIVA